MDLSELSHYDMMAEYGTPYFHWGGLKATDRLSELCHVSEGKKVLIVGCGTGYTACYLSDNYGCFVTGIDISPRMIERAIERKEKLQVGERVDFQVADAYDLPFPAEDFDIVLTEFVSVFLEKPGIFHEFARVLKHGGYIGINELYKLEEIPEHEANRISEAEDAFEESTGFPLRMPSINQWIAWFHEAGLQEIRTEKIEGKYSFNEYAYAVGGKINALRVFGRLILGMITNGRLRRRIIKIGKIKEVLIRNKSTRDFCGAVLVTGVKSL